MVGFPPALDRLVQTLGRLPGIGRKSATRIALKLVSSSDAECRELADSVIEAKACTVECSRCGSFTEGELCSICLDARRDPEVLCVVERASDVLALERTGRFRGRYHVLGGLLSPLDGVGPENLRIETLLERAASNDVNEVILALNPTAEGEATSLYLARVLAVRTPKVTKLASGLPVGGELDLADELTLGAALEERRQF
ncbi:recombination mediator RecR [bacterium]|nr:recombination mediator RecR [bacterium]